MNPAHDAAAGVAYYSDTEAPGVALTLAQLDYAKPFPLDPRDIAAIKALAPGETYALQHPYTVEWAPTWGTITRLPADTAVRALVGDGNVLGMGFTDEEARENAEMLYPDAEGGEYVDGTLGALSAWGEGLPLPQRVDPVHTVEHSLVIRSGDGLTLVEGTVTALRGSGDQKIGPDYVALAPDDTVRRIDVDDVADEDKGTPNDPAWHSDAWSREATYTVLDNGTVLGRGLTAEDVAEAMRKAKHGGDATVYDDRDGTIVISGTDGGEATLNMVETLLEDHERQHVVAPGAQRFGASARESGVRS